MQHGISAAGPSTPLAARHLRLTEALTMGVNNRSGTRRSARALGGAALLLLLLCHLAAPSSSEQPQAPQPAGCDLPRIVVDIWNDPL